MKALLAALVVLGPVAAAVVAQQRSAPVEAPFVLEPTYWIESGEAA